MFSDVMTIISKELTRIFTDKKLVFTTFILPAVSIVLIYAVMGLMIQSTMSDKEEHLGQIGIIGMPESFSQFIANKEKDYKVKIVIEKSENEKTIKDAIYKGDMDALVVFDENFDAKIQSYDKGNTTMPNIDTFYNPTEDYSDATHSKFADRIMADYEKQVLVQRFGDENFLKAFTLNNGNKEHQLAPPEKMSGDILGGLIPFLLSIFLFSGGMGIGIDIITGEKERGTMGSLLVTPIKREAIAFGKMLSLGIVSLLSTASSIIGMGVAFPFLMMAFSNETETAAANTATTGPNLFVLSPSGVAQFLVLSILLTLIYVGIICIISVYANSVKEAGTLITPAYMGIMVLGMMTMFTNKMPEWWAFGIPLYGTLMGMKHALSAELTWAVFGLNILVSVVFIGAIVWLIKQMFNSEKIMFGA